MAAGNDGPLEQGPVLRNNRITRVGIDGRVHASEGYGRMRDAALAHDCAEDLEQPEFQCVDIHVQRILAAMRSGNMRNAYAPHKGASVASPRRCLR